MGKVVFVVFFALALVVAGTSSSFALQSGGVEIGDLATGSVVGQPFSQLDVDVDLYALEIGGKKVWYPGTSVLRLVGRAGRPAVIRVTNNTKADHGFDLSADSAYAAPTSMHI
ncbi:hypothetical protein MYX04_09400, partial [Nitrospiraceae bacterium AH_259_D15_M11_P09]|nr:hypothetical protein [Nitrospiraceae bacterium AH_259_D15_M11_P09]